MGLVGVTVTVSVLSMSEVDSRTVIDHTAVVFGGQSLSFKYVVVSEAEAQVSSTDLVGHAPQWASVPYVPRSGGLVWAGVA